TRVAITDLESANEKANPGIDTEKAKKQSETVEGAGSRKWVGIAAPDDVTGGYLLEAEMQSRYPAETSGFVTASGQHIVLKSPEYAAKEEVDYIAGLYGEMEQALYAPDGRNTQGKDYTEYFDMDQLVKMYTLTEYTFHRDAGISSCYFYKDAGESVFHAGPAWDFDLSLGNTRYAGGLPFDVTNAASWWANSLYYRDADQPTQTIYTLLYRHEDFRARTAEQWQALSQTVAAELKELPRMIDDTAPSAVMNSLRWRQLSGGTPEEKEASYRKQAEQMARFAEARRTALDKGFGPEAAMVYFDANGGSGRLFNGTMLNVGGKITLPDIDGPVMTLTAPENCVFTGWNTRPDGSGKQYEPSDQVAVTQKTTVFYARWESVAPKEPKPPLTKDTYFDLGDVDLSGAVDAADARLTLRAAVHLEETDATFLRLADADGDQQISPADARLILRAAVKLHVLPAQAVLVAAGYVSKV
ncbi:MAG: CotH kinase family protein, partial [Clostridia bacterium]|nr:CotH kinase family protein [Clostridia bacterium]